MTDQILQKHIAKLRDEELQFYIEAPAATPVAEVASQAAEMHNLICRIQRICLEGAGFAEQAMQSQGVSAPEESTSPDVEPTALAADTGGALPDAASAVGSGAAAAVGSPVVTAPQPDSLTSQPVAASEASPALRTAAATAAATDTETAAGAAGGALSLPVMTSLEAGSGATDTKLAAAAPSKLQQPETAPAGVASDVALESQTPAEALCRALLAASKLTDKERAAKRQLLTAGELHNAIAAVKAAADAAVFSGLQLGGRFTTELQGSSPPDEGMGADIAPETAVLWLANRCLDGSKTLAAEVGRNEKTRAVMSIQRAREPAPPKSSEPPEGEYKQMLAFYYQKQEENKRLEEDMDLGYYNSPWADPGAMKQRLSGMRGVQMPYAPRPAFS